jgi:type II secretory pathway pseudopilin PulG
MFMQANFLPPRRVQTLRARERGLSLLLALLLLAIISVVAVGSMQNANLQERIAGNSRDRSLAYNAAESAIREAEEYLDTDDVLPVFLGGRTAGHYIFNTFPSGSLTPSREKPTMRRPPLSGMIPQYLPTSKAVVLFVMEPSLWVTPLLFPPRFPVSLQRSNHCGYLR